MNIENIIDSYQQAHELAWREVVQVAEDMGVPIYSEVEMASSASIQVNIDEHYKRCVAALQEIAQLADTGSEPHRQRFNPNGDGDGIANGWRVAEAMREIANHVVGNIRLGKSSFAIGDRVRIKQGIDRGHYGTVTHVDGDDLTYLGIKLDCHDKEVGYSAYEVEFVHKDEPAWVSRFASGNCEISSFVAKEIADQVRELLFYKRAMESMASQFIDPKMTAMQLAEIQLSAKPKQ